MGAKKFAIAAVIAESCDVYKKIFGRLFVVILVLSFPLTLIHQLTLLRFIRANADPAMINGFSFLMFPVHLLPSLIILMLAANQLESGESPIMRAVGTALCRWFKVLVTGIMMIFAILLPLVATGLILSVAARSSGSMSPVSLALLAFLLGVPSFVYAVLFAVYWMFLPMAVLCRGKWLFSGFSYSFSLVRKRWRSIALLGFLMLCAVGLTQVPLILSGSSLLMLVFVLITTCAVAFLQTVYATAFIALESDMDSNG